MTLDPDGFSRLQRIFDEAQSLPPEDRSAFVKAQAGGDAELERRANDLLALGSGAPTDGLRAGVQGVLDHGPLPPQAQIGKYRLLDEVGRGSYGVVYRAERTDLESHVAIKVSQHASEGVLRRFEFERRALSSMSSPYIARLFDAGETDAGKPYFVMELVDGVPLHRYCRERGLDLRSRLQLFCKVCEGVRHAHGKGIVHRDLKPANVLVGDEGGVAVPKVLDFGLSKALEGSGREDADKSVGSEKLGTYEYMSPEQARGRVADMGVQTDVFALGAMLFELLCEEPTISRAEIRRIVESDGKSKLFQVLEAREPQNASARIKAPALRRRVQGDLDLIVRKAMANEVEGRYETVAALAEDIESHLQHRPIQAAPGSAVYVAKKFVRRNWGLVVSASLVFLVGLVGAVGVASTNAELKISARRLEGQAELGRALARAVREEIEPLLRGLRGATPARTALASVTQDYLLGLLGLLPPGDFDFRRDIADGFVRLGEVRAGLHRANTGDAPGALGMFDRAVSIYRELPSESRSTEGLQFEVQAWAARGDVLGNRFGTNMNQRESARASYGQAMMVLDELDSAYSDDRPTSIEQYLAIERAHLLIKRGDTYLPSPVSDERAELDRWRSMLGRGSRAGISGLKTLNAVRMATSAYSAAAKCLASISRPQGGRNEARWLEVKFVLGMRQFGLAVRIARVLPMTVSLADLQRDAEELVMLNQSAQNLELMRYEAVRGTVFSLGALATAHELAGRFAQALKEVELAVATLAEVYEGVQSGSNAEILRDLVYCYGGGAMIAMRGGRLDRAALWFDEAVPRCRELQAVDPTFRQGFGLYSPSQFVYGAAICAFELGQLDKAHQLMTTVQAFEREMDEANGWIEFEAWRLVLIYEALRGDRLDKKAVDACIALGMDIGVHPRLLLALRGVEVVSRLEAGMIEDMALTAEDSACLGEVESLSPRGLDPEECALFLRIATLMNRVDPGVGSWKAAMSRFAKGSQVRRERR